MSLVMYSYFHKSFPFNHNSDWLLACYARNPDPFMWMPPDEQGKYIDVGQNIQKFKHYYSSASQDQFLTALAQQAAEYDLMVNTPNVDYIGCTTYRRYLLLDRSAPKNVTKLSMPATQDVANSFGTQEQKEIALEYLKTADVLTNHSVALPCSVEEQYLQSQPPEYWNLFKQAINELFPSYRQHLTWFTHNNLINFETTYIMKKEAFCKYADEFFRVLKYIYTNSSNVYPTQQTTSEPLPWRYPGFLGERFFPFFVYANSLKRIQVPLVILQ